MSVEFFTAQVSQHNAKAQNAAKNAASSSLGPNAFLMGQSGFADFEQMILANANKQSLMSEQINKATRIDLYDALISLDGALKDILGTGITTSFEGLKSAELSAELEALLNNLPPGSILNAGQAGSNLSVFDATEGAKDGDVLFAQILQNTSQANGKFNIGALIATGLTPQQMTEALNGKSGLPNGALVGTQANSAASTNAAEDLIAYLGLTQLSQQELSALRNNLSKWWEDSGQNLNLSLKNSSSLSPDALAKIAMAKAQAANLVAGAPQNTGALGTGAANAESSFTLTGDTFELLTSLNGLLDGEWADPMGEQWNMRAALPNALAGGNMISALTQSAHAGSAHPATQMVAATIQRQAAAAPGDARNMTIHLNPPVLGKVEARMAFDSKNKLSVHMVVEKPETLLMLQRDAHLLERSLQEAGLDTSGSDLSFELAQQDTGSDGRSKNSYGGSGQGSESNEGEMEIIETKMNWFIDPQTGAQRYNLVV